MMCNYIPNVVPLMIIKRYTFLITMISRTIASNISRTLQELYGSWMTCLSNIYIKQWNIIHLNLVAYFATVRVFKKTFYVQVFEREVPRKRNRKQWGIVEEFARKKSISSWLNFSSSTQVFIFLFPLFRTIQAVGSKIIWIKSVLLFFARTNPTG